MKIIELLDVWTNVCIIIAFSGMIMFAYVVRPRWYNILKGISTFACFGFAVKEAWRLALDFQEVGDAGKLGILAGVTLMSYLCYLVPMLAIQLVDWIVSPEEEELDDEPEYSREMRRLLDLAKNKVIKQNMLSQIPRLDNGFYRVDELGNFIRIK